MDYVPPDDLLEAALAAASKKAELSVRDMLIHGFLAGAILGYATSLAFVVTTQGLAPIVGAVLFPVGFVMLVLLGLEPATGNCALLPTFPVRIDEGMVSVQLPIERHDPDSAPALCHHPDRPVRWVQRKAIQSSTLAANGAESGESGICLD